MKFTSEERELLKNRKLEIIKLAEEVDVSIKIMQEEIIVVSRIKKDLETLIQNALNTPNSGAHVSTVLRNLFIRLHFLIEANSLQFLFEADEAIFESCEKCINETMSPGDQMELMITSYYEQLEDSNGRS